MDEIGGQFTEIYIKKPENVTLILQLLEVCNLEANLHHSYKLRFLDCFLILFLGV